MHTTIFAAVVDKLNDDATLQGYFGSTFFAYRAKMAAPAQIPSISVGENTEKSAPRVGSLTTKRRDASPTLQIDIWVSSHSEEFPCTGEDADTIAERVDELLLTPSKAVTGTLQGSWSKVSGSQQHEDDTTIWHNALRYSFQYSLTDT